MASRTERIKERGPEQAFNSLDARREIREACIAGQKHQGWIAKYRGDPTSGVAGLCQPRDIEFLNWPGGQPGPEETWSKNASNAVPPPSQPPMWLAFDVS